MFGRNVPTTLLTAVACLYTTIASATIPTAYDCNNCTDTQLHNLAVTKGQALGNPSTVYIYDLVNDHLKKYRVSSEPIFGGTQYTVQERTPTAGETADYDMLHDVWQSTNHTMKRTVVINPGGSNPPGSPAFPSQILNFLNDPTNMERFYGLVTTTQMQNYLSQYATNWMSNYVNYPGDPAAASVWDFINADTPSLTFFNINKGDIGLTVVISIPGGGTAYMALTVGPGGVPVWKLVKLVDRNNITVPLTPADVASTNGSTTNYNFSDHQSDMQYFLYFLSHGLNVTVNNQGGNWIVGCVTAGGTKVCTVLPL